MPLPPPSPYRFLVGGIVVIVTITGALNFMGVAPLFPVLMQEFNIDRTSISLLNSLVMMVMMFLRIPAGVLAARFGIWLVYGVGALLMGAQLLIVLTDSYPTLLVVRVLFAVGDSLVAATAAGVIMSWFRGRELPFINGLNFVGGSIGMSLTLFFTVPLSAALGWRQTLALYGVLPVGLGIVWFIFGRGRGLALAQSAAEPPTFATLMVALRQRTTLLLGLTFIGPMSLWSAFTSWLPTYYFQVFDWSLADAAATTGIFNVVGIPACILGATLASRVTNRRPFFLIPGSIIGFVALASFLVNNAALNYAAVAVLGFCIWGYLPVAMTLPMELPKMTPQIVVVVVAAGFTIGNFGSFMSPLVVGFLADMTGSFLPGFVFYSLFSFSLFFGGNLLAKAAERAHQAEALVRG